MSHISCRRGIQNRVMSLRHSSRLLRSPPEPTSTRWMKHLVVPYISNLLINLLKGMLMTTSTRCSISSTIFKRTPLLSVVHPLVPWALSRNKMLRRSKRVSWRLTLSRWPGRSRFFQTMRISWSRSPLRSTTDSRREAILQVLASDTMRISRKWISTRKTNPRASSTDARTSPNYKAPSPSML